MTTPRTQAWISPSGLKLDVFVPFLGKYHRPVSGRCCQTCTPRSWDGFYPEDLAALGFRDASRVTEADTRFRGWLVRRVCGFLAAWEWKIPAESPGELLARVCSSRRVQDAASGREPGSGGDEGSQRRWKEEVCQILGEIQAPLSPLLLRLCHWLLPKLLTRLFLGVQLHRGQLEMVLRAARTPEVPLVFLCSHQSPLDGPLLSFLLLSQGIGLPRVAVSPAAGPRLRSLLQRLGGIFLPSGMAPARSARDEGLPGAVLDAYVQEVLRSRQPLVLFLEEPWAALRLAEPARRWLLRLLRALRDGAVPDVLLVPVGITYDLAPGRAERDAAPPQPLGVGSCLRAAFQALLCRRPGCAQVDFSQPFSLREFLDNNLVRPVLTGSHPEQLLLPTILGRRPLDVGTVGTSGPTLGTEEEILVTALGLHALSGEGGPGGPRIPRDGVPCSGVGWRLIPPDSECLSPAADSRACCAVTAVGITAALLLHRHQEVGEGFRPPSPQGSIPGGIPPPLRAAFPVGFPLPRGQHSQQDPGAPQVLLLPRLMWDFWELLEQLLLRGRAVGFSGQLRALVGHSLRLLQPPRGRPGAAARARLGWLAGGVRHHLAGEAVGACAIRALLLEVLPILGPPSSLTRIVLSRDELLHKILELLQLLPPTLLGLQVGTRGWPGIPSPAGALGGDRGVACRTGLACHPFAVSPALPASRLPQPGHPGQAHPGGAAGGGGGGRHPRTSAGAQGRGGSEVRCQLLSPQAEGERWGCDVAPRRCWRGPSLGFFTDDSDSDSEHGVPKQCYKLREPQSFPGFLLFLCRLLSPVLQTYGRAVQFLQRPPWPQPEADCVEALLEFLAEDEDGYPDRSLALSSLQSFKDMGVLEELQTPVGPALQLSQPFQSASNRERLAAFIQQFTQL
ncbi:glycerol-3-phosphate acyltransferase 2, mitochondrial-like isoform X1 [Motacilla alba alba]|uniref:glycerol-3-phosphate acyltransferase 2, mitochondrial-like isoform X1 n=1 Tax=Motacilla alba alba TaxID=1094192 RepID=UPI0018D53509|nr:glycerol-3-phosphate acyltransferase 2, mitochondrial-like isoform X1 [Motacilla alba alba]